MVLQTGKFILTGAVAYNVNETHDYDERDIHAVHRTSFRSAFRPTANKQSCF